MEKKKKNSERLMVLIYSCIGALCFISITCLGFAGYALYRTPIIAREQQMQLREWEAEKRAQAAETARIIAEKEQASAQAKLEKTNASGNVSTSASSAPGNETIRGLPVDTPVYVSDNADLIHAQSDCSGMKYYRAMSIQQADASGYEYCEDCW